VKATNGAVKIDILRGTQKMSFNVTAVLARERMNRMADLPDPIKSHIEPLGILGLDLDEKLGLAAGPISAWAWSSFLDGR
jgi:hypothetical protein